MKIATKFFTSSIALCVVITTLVGGTNLWVGSQAKKFQLERQRILAVEDKFLELESHLNQQIAALKDFLVLDRRSVEMVQYQKSKSEFLITLDELEQQIPNNPSLQSLGIRYQNLQEIADNLADFEEAKNITQQDILSINSFRRDINLYLENLRQEIRLELEENLEKEEDISRFLGRVILILTVLIALLMYLQYRLVVTPVLQSLGKLSKGVSRVSDGDFEYRLNLVGNNEITRVAASFDEMTDVLEELYEELEEKVDKRTVQLELTNDDLKVEILKREVIEGELRSTYEDTRRSQQLLLGIINATLDWIFVKDTQLRFVLVNESFAQHFGMPADDIIGKTIFDLESSFEESSVDPEQHFEMVRLEDETVLKGEPIHNPSDYVTDSHNITYVFDTQKSPLYNDQNEIIGILGVSRDVTERHLSQEAIEQSEVELRQKANELKLTLEQLQKTQAQIIQSEKMSSLGQMVAGVAHEINNPVNFISGNVKHAKSYIADLIQIIRLYQSEYPEPTETIQEEIEDLELEFIIEDIPKLLSSMTLGAERIKEIVKSLRNFSRLDESEMKSVDIHTGLDSTLMILQSRLKGKQDHTEIQVVKHYGELPLIECYPGQLNQVFMNILSNAIDALHEYSADKSPAELAEKPNQITITTQQLVSMPNNTQDWILIRIHDNGAGIPEKVRKKLFNPFFTTKDVGKGTGLGLSISHSIVVEKHGGQLSCFSELGHGAEFMIEIPVHAKKA